MVERAVGNADKREVALERGRGDRRERAVTARHAQRVRLRLAGQRVRILALAHDVGHDPSFARSQNQVVR